MKLITKAIAKKLPMIGANGDKKTTEVKVPLKLFNPSGAGTWYVTELDAKNNEAFGYVTGLGSDELGYISVHELEAFRGRFGLGIERDLHWDGETTLAQVIAGERR